MRKWVTSAVEIAGISLVSVGVGLFDYRFALISAGVGLVAVGIGAAA
jgi:hypothetical protein